MSLRDPEDVQARTSCSISSEVTEAQSEPEDAETELADGDKNDVETTLMLSKRDRVLSINEETQIDDHRWATDDGTRDPNWHKQDGTC